jgi:carbamoyl-phosphate synthase large subunit
MAPRDLGAAGEIAGLLLAGGAELYATGATFDELSRVGVAARSADRGEAGAAALVRKGEFSLVVSTTRGGEPAPENTAIRRAALWAGVPCLTSVEAARACAAAGRPGEALQVRSLQRWEALARS